MNCVDASVSAKWIFVEEYTAKARALANDARRAREALVAPPVLRGELCNIIRQKMRRSGLSIEEARERLRLFQTYPVLIAETPRLYDTALVIADRYNLPAAYDAIYVALAQLRGEDLWTDDRRLLNTLGGRLPFVKWIGDYPAA